METYKDQDKRLAKDILERNYFSHFRKGKNELELFLFGHCDAKCEYCYIKKRGENLYPFEISDKNLILNNLKSFLNFYKSNKFTCVISIFSSEWLDKKDLYDPVFNIFYETFKETDYKPRYLDIPSNCRFIESKEKTIDIQNWIDKFKEIEIEILISASIDGLYCDDGRTKENEEFYENLFSFMNKNNFYAHPMVSSSNVKNWIKNYEWWRTNAPEQISKRLMMLEVRDETWTNESIQNLLQFLNYEIDYKFKNDFNENKRLFLKYILGKQDPAYEIPLYNNLSIINLMQNKSLISCSARDASLVVRMGDLAIPICHRLSYDELLIGKFVKNENNEIIDFDEQNVVLLTVKSNLDRQYFPHCESCKYRLSCVGFCLGNAYENYKNFLVPTMEVCNMYSSKIPFLIMKYADMGLFEELENINITDKELKYLTNILIDLSEGVKDD